jgi:uncharacterized membrane protein YdbT with pleckstrin-like domain
VATIDVETAMGHGRDLRLSVLGLADAERFREQLLGAAHLEARGASITDEPLITLNRHDLLLGALTENHLTVAMAGISTISGPAIGLILEHAAKLSAYAATAVIAGSLMAIFVAAWLWGAAKYYLKYGDFVVRRSENVFRISYGLLNKVQTAIRPGRIEYVRLSTSLPQRFLRRTSLHFGTASSFGEAGVLAPVALFVEKYRALNGIEDVIPGLDIAKLKWTPFHPVFYRARLLAGLIPIGILAAVAGSVTVLVGGATALITWAVCGLVAAIVAMPVIATYLARPENGFAVTEDAIVVRQGYFHQFVFAMPIERLENVAITQPSWWKRQRAVNVMVQGMKHRLKVGAMPQSEVDILLARWHDKIESQEFRRGQDTLAETIRTGAKGASSPSSFVAAVASDS